jgi:hypothetical protein
VKVPNGAVSLSKSRHVNHFMKQKINSMIESLTN